MISENVVPAIIPMRDLSNKTIQIAETCEKTGQPIFVTKNGYGTLVVMSMKAYGEKMAQLDIYEKIVEGEKDIEAGRVSTWEKVSADLQHKIQQWEK